MNTLYTIGYTAGIDADLLARAVVGEGMMLVDTRFSPRSRNPQWNKSRLQETMGEHYRWVQEVGNVNYKGEGEIELLSPSMGIPIVIRLLEQSPVILMCGCWNVHECHRKTVAEMVAEACGCEVMHIGKKEVAEWADRHKSQPTQTSFWW